MNLTRHEFTTISNQFGLNFANFAEANLAGWAIEILCDGRTNSRGPQRGTKINQQFFAAHPEWAKYA